MVSLPNRIEVEDGSLQTSTIRKQILDIQQDTILIDLTGNVNHTFATPDSLILLGTLQCWRNEPWLRIVIIGHLWDILESNIAHE